VVGESFAYFIDVELAKLRAKATIHQTAWDTYTASLNAELAKLNQG
jgi:hypothetical protein